MECQRQRRARTLSPLPPRTVEQPQACSISRSGSLVNPSQRQRPAGAWLECQRQRRARTLSPLPPCTVEQPQACSISRRGSMAAPSQQQRPAGAWLECQRQRRARTLSPHPPRTVEQPQACSISAFPVDSFTKAKTCRCLVGVPAAETSTHLESASASHRGAAASLLDQSELHGGSFRCKVQTRPARA